MKQLTFLFVFSSMIIFQHESAVQAADACSAARQGLQQLENALQTLINERSKAQGSPVSSPPGRTGIPVRGMGNPNPPVAEPSPDDVAYYNKQIATWHTNNDGEVKKLTALLSSGQCAPIWTADDGGFYYVRTNGNQFVWLGMSNDGGSQSGNGITVGGLQNGFTFCNVFWGTINGNTVQGQWADVPRGAANNSGTLSLSFDYDLFGNLNGIHKLSSTGNFGAGKWHPSDYPTPPVPVLDAFKQTTKNTKTLAGHQTLDDNLGIFKDPVVLIGAMKPAYADNPQLLTKFPQLPFNCSFPADPVQHPRIFSEFHRYDAVINGPPDYDTCFDLSVSLDSPVSTSLFNGLFDGMTSDAKAWVKTVIGRDVHCEIIMFGRPTDGSKILLPGWAELGGNSVIVDGRPANAVIDIDPSTTAVRSFAGVTYHTGDIVRVTGAMVHDKGHENFLTWESSIDKDEEVEIHPVYSIDRCTATGTDNLSGVWFTDDGGTIYLHQIQDLVWGLWTRPYHENIYTTVMQGTIAGNVLTMTWLDVPTSYSARRDEGSLSLKLSDDRLNLTWNQSSPPGIRTCTKFRNTGQ